MKYFHVLYLIICILIIADCVRPDSDMDGVPDPPWWWKDTDGDGTSDFADECPNDQYKTQPLYLGCGNYECDFNSDGLVCEDDYIFFLTQEPADWLPGVRSTWMQMFNIQWSTSCKDEKEILNVSGI